MRPRGPAVGQRLTAWRATVAGRTLAALGLAAVLLAAPLGAAGQPAVKGPRIGVLLPGSLAAPETQAPLDAFRQGLSEHGYREGQNIVAEYRAADGSVERLPDLATELARLHVDLIVAMTTPAARAAQQATTTIPIVGSNMGDPVRDGLVASLARPGGNITGTAFLGPELVPKRLELLKEALPGETPESMRGPGHSSPTERASPTGPGAVLPTWTGS